MLDVRHLFKMLGDTNNRRRINNVLICVFVVNAVFVPADPWELKKIALILLLGLNLDAYFKMKTRAEWISFLFGFVLTSLNILISGIHTGDIVGNVIRGYMGYILMLYPVIKQYHIDFIEISQTTILGLAWFIIIMAALDLSGLIPMETNNVLMWFYHSENAMVGKGAHLATGYLIFMKASPLILMCIPQYFVKRKFLIVGGLTAALLIAGTRANMLMCLLVLLSCYIYQYIWKEQDRKRKYSRAAIIAIVAVLVITNRHVIAYVADMFARKSGGDAVRDSTLISIFEAWRNKPVSFFIGSGFTSEFYNSGIGSMASNVELSYWNLLRQVGLISFLLMMAMYFWPVYRMTKGCMHVVLTVGYLAYLVVAYTNPLLYSSTGMLAVLYMYCLSDNTNQKQKSLV